MSTDSMSSSYNAGPAPVHLTTATESLLRPGWPPPVSGCSHALRDEPQREEMVDLLAGDVVDAVDVEFGALVPLVRVDVVGRVLIPALEQPLVAVPARLRAAAGQHRGDQAHVRRRTDLQLEAGPV